MKKKFRAYMCGTAWTCEMGQTDVTIYPDTEELRSEQGCSEECGIVEVEIKLIKWTERGKNEVDTSD